MNLGLTVEAVVTNSASPRSRVPAGFLLHQIKYFPGTSKISRHITRPGWNASIVAGNAVATISLHPTSLRAGDKTEHRKMEWRWHLFPRRRRRASSKTAPRMSVTTALS
jgi:hypothetical protein